MSSFWRHLRCHSAWTPPLLAPHAFPNNPRFQLWKVALYKYCVDTPELPTSLEPTVSLIAMQKFQIFRQRISMDSICLVCHMGSPNCVLTDWFQVWTDLGVSNTWSCTTEEENSRISLELEVEQVLIRLLYLLLCRLPAGATHLH